MARITARQIADTFETIAPIASGIEGDQLGFIFGDPSAQVRGVACMWNAHSASIRAAIDQDLNMLIVHEALFYGPQKSPWYTGPERSEDIVANRKRRRLLEDNGIVVYRSHSNWDALPEDGVADQAVKALGIGGLTVHASRKFFRVHRLAHPMAVKDLAACAQKGLCVPCTRIFGEGSREITRFAFLIGGFGENQIHMPQAAVEMGAEALIIGEMSEFVVIAALECGVPVVETLHSSSEIPAIKRQAEILQARLPDIPIRYVPSGCLHFKK